MTVTDEECDIDIDELLESMERSDKRWGDRKNNAYYLLEKRFTFSKSKSNKFRGGEGWKVTCIKTGHSISGEPCWSNDIKYRLARFYKKETEGDYLRPNPFFFENWVKITIWGSFE